MTYNFYMNKDPKGKQIEFAIYLYVREGTKTITLHTGERIGSKYWDTKTQKIKRSYIGHPELNEYLFAFRERVKRLVRLAKLDNPEVSFNELEYIIKKEFKHKEKSELFQIFDLFISTREPTVTKSTTYKFMTLKKQIEDCFKKESIKISLDTIDHTSIDILRNYYIKAGMSNNTIFKNLQFFKSFLRWAYSRNYTKNQKFETYRNVNTYDSDTIALTPEELTKLWKHKFSDPKLEKVRDLFMFLVLTGQRYSDMANLKENQIIDGVWHLRQQKTKHPLVIKLQKEAKEILRKYNNHLPIISNQKMNSYLKEIGQELGFDKEIVVSKYSGAEQSIQTYKQYELLTTHTARRTAISIMSYNNMNQQVIKSVTGQSSDKTVDKYFKPNPDATKNEMEKVFSFLE